jgi:hypothetical protein
MPVSHCPEKLVPRRAASSSPRRRNQRDDFALVSPVNAKVFDIHSDDTVFGINLAHSDKAEIGKIRFAIFVSFCESSQLWKMIVAVKGQSYEAVSDHFERQSDVLKMKGCFCQHCFAGQQWLSDLLCHAHGPLVMHVPATGKRNQKAGIRDAFHCFENPLRVERSRVPLRILPARRMNFFDELSRDRARSRCCRTSSPCEIPVRAEVSSIHVARLFGRRIVNV